MANKKKEYYKPKPMTEGKRNIIQGLLQEYNIESAADIQEALKDLLGGTIKEMMEAEMDEHLGWNTTATRPCASPRWSSLCSTKRIAIWTSWRICWTNMCSRWPLTVCWKAYPYRRGRLHGHCGAGVRE